MADSDDFVAIARVVERATTLNELQTRGLIRRLLRQAGLDSKQVTATQLAAIGKMLLHEALVKNGVVDPPGVIRQWLECCTRQAEAARGRDHMRVSNTVEEVFARMGLRR